MFPCMQLPRFQQLRRRVSSREAQPQQSLPIALSEYSSKQSAGPRARCMGQPPSSWECCRPCGSVSRLRQMYPCLILADHRNSVQVCASWIPRFERLAGPCVSITTTRPSYVAASQITAAPAHNDGKVVMTAPNLIVDYMGAASQTGLVGLCVISSYMVYRRYTHAGPKELDTCRSSDKYRCASAGTC